MENEEIKNEEVLEEEVLEEEKEKIYTIRKLKFNDIKKMAEFISRLDVSTDELSAMVKGLTNNNTNKIVTLPDLEKYITETEGPEKFEYLMNVYDNQTLKIIEYVDSKRAAEDGRVDAIISITNKLISIVAVKFNVISDLLLYFITNLEKDELDDMDAGMSIALIKKLFTSHEFKSFFSAMSK